MNAKRIKSVEDAIEWAYRHGYTGAKRAADDYTRATDCAFTIADLGTYGDTLRFHDSPAAANKAVMRSVYPGQYRKPDDGGD